MHSPQSPRSTGGFGPHPKHALLPVLAVVGFCGWLYLQHRDLELVPAGAAVTVMRPVADAADEVDEAAESAPAAADGDVATP